MDKADDNTDFSRQIREQGERKLKARRLKLHTVWMGFGMFGLVGWSVAVPTLLGIMMGAWLDKNHPQKFSWTLALLFAGLIIGCANAWFWISNEHKKMHDQNDKNET